MLLNTKNLSISYDKLLRKINASENEKLTNQLNKNTTQYPCAMLPHNSGALIGIRPTPQGFYPHSFDNETTTNSRRQYFRTQEKEVCSNAITQTKYTPPEDYSLRVATLRSNAIGKSSYKEGLPNSSPLSYKGSYSTLNDEKTARRRARSSGSVAPAKKNGLNNKSYV